VAGEGSVGTFACTFAHAFRLGVFAKWFYAGPCMDTTAQVHIAIYVILAFAFQVAMFLELKGKKFQGVFAFFIIFACAMEALAAQVYLTGEPGPNCILSVAAIVIALALTGIASVISRIPFPRKPFRR